VSIGVEIASRLMGVGDDGVPIPERIASEGMVGGYMRREELVYIPIDSDSSSSSSSSKPSVS
jgi:hypothetical protein